MNLKVKLANIEFKNPVTVASGTFAHAEKYYSLEEVKELGSIIPKTVTLHAQTGNPPVRIAETPSGMLNAIGIENLGGQYFVDHKLPSLRKIGVPIIVSILGHAPDQFEELTEIMNQAEGITALELNLSCPNLNHKTLVAQDPKATFDLISKVKKISKYPVSAKLSPNVTDIRDIAKAAEEAGADALSLINTLTGLSINVKKRKSVLGNFTGGLSGPAIRPVALHMVHQVYKEVNIPIIASGGIMTADDALQFLIAGASFLAVGTANFINPRAPIDVLEGVKGFMQQEKMENIQDLIGSLEK